MPAGDFTLTDDFEVPDGPLTGTDQPWVEGSISSAPSWRVTDERAHINSGDTPVEALVNELVPSNQFAQVDVHLPDLVTLEDGASAGPMVRHQILGVSLLPYYRLQLTPPDPPEEWLLTIWADDLTGALKSVPIDEPTFPLTLKLEATGNLLRGYLNGQRLIEVAADDLASGQIGMYAEHAHLDNFIGGEAADLRALVDPDGEVIRDPDGGIIFAPPVNRLSSNVDITTTAKAAVSGRVTSTVTVTTIVGHQSPTGSLVSTVDVTTEVAGHRLSAVHVDLTNAAPVGAGRVPIALRPMEPEETSLVTEDGDDLVDENGDVLIYD